MNPPLDPPSPPITELPDDFWVGAADGTDPNALRRVATRFGITPASAPHVSSYGIWLDELGWALHAPIALGFTPLRLDFSAGATGLRLRQAGRRQPLGRAIGLKPGIRLHVVDATAGLGRDGAVLAQLGCEVTMIERSPVMALLLRDGWDRTAPAEAHTRVSVYCDDARHALDQLASLPDAVYLDPMYPHRDKSALVKKEMRVIRDLVGDDPDAGELLLAALDCGARRVVVKRPRGAPTLPGPAPLRHIEGPNTRYDIYAPHDSAVTQRPITNTPSPSKR
ncbi:hypothetical protein BI364_09040 [Acidihalobacter yilgarnensis]|uniref:Ribosomal RNA small subunit methyltransferase J n=1 Tax=Acidihalobacter yilgarnensis TaxID=2819280 RepID=A0A1D8INN7_9GAMM|nr:class I SAM-dependent methyltransferase [Acidihalobacter yilgarnensis]AOU98086.1 hypothetical protein BI364_09040 [Acidihalobacter yilgarnensis]